MLPTPAAGASIPSPDDMVYYTISTGQKSTVFLQKSFFIILSVFFQTKFKYFWEVVAYLFIFFVRNPTRTRFFLNSAPQIRVVQPIKQMEMGDK